MSSENKKKTVDLLRLHVPASKVKECLERISEKCITTKNIHNLRQSLRSSSEEGTFKFEMHAFIMISGR